jgi:hypothetical protein
MRGDRYQAPASPGRFSVRRVSLCDGVVLCGDGLGGPSRWDLDQSQGGETIAAAAAGDVVEIAPVKDGYFACAVLRANHLTVEGSGPDVGFGFFAHRLMLDRRVDETTEGLIKRRKKLFRGQI